MSHCLDNLSWHAEKHFLNSKDILIVGDMNQLSERTAASSDDMKCDLDVKYNKRMFSPPFSIFVQVLPQKFNFKCAQKN